MQLPDAYHTRIGFGYQDLSGGERQRISIARAILKNPKILPNSKEKYQAAKSLVEKVDFTFTRETKTLNDIFYFGDAILSSDTAAERTIAFNFQYGNNYVRLMFYCYDRFVFKVEEIVK